MRSRRLAKYPRRLHRRQREERRTEPLHKVAACKHDCDDLDVAVPRNGRRIGQYCPYATPKRRRALHCAEVVDERKIECYAVERGARGSP